MFKKRYIILFLVELLVIIGLVFIIVGRFSPGEPSTARPETVSVSTANATHTLLFVGDMMFDRLVQKRVEAAADPLLPFEKIKSTLDAADLRFGNLEGPISDRGTNQGSIYSFEFQPASTTEALKYAHFDVLNLANNHIWDYGRQAASDTMAYLDQSKIDYVGFGRNYDQANTPVIKTVGDTKIAFLGYTEFYSKSAWATSTRLGLSEYDQDKIIARVAALKKSGQTDIIVVSLHWGVEYKTKSEPWQQKFAHKLIDVGADLVIGHHPHVAQELEPYKDGFIAYSLGNFVFDQNFSTSTQSGLMLRVPIVDKKVGTPEQLEIKFTKDYQPYLK